MRLRAIVIVATLLVSPGSADTSAAETYEERIDVLEVQVPVNVIAPDGSPVRGLTSEDFTVREGRREREIRDFRTIDLEALQPTEGRIEMDQVLPAEGRRHFLLVFDLTFSSPGSILRARQAARAFVLSALHPTDLGAVMTFSEQAGFRLLVTFTSDRAQLARAIDLLGSRELSKGQTEDPLRFVVDGPSQAAEAEGRSASSADFDNSITDSMQEALDSTEAVMERERERHERRYERGRIETWVKHLDFLAGALSGVAGRKQIVYFSEGFDDRLLMGQGARHRMQDESLSARIGHRLPVDPEAAYGDLSLLSDITRVLMKFEKSGSSIQAVDIAGVGTRPTGFLHSTLARETGGVVVENTNELEEGLGSILRGSQVTYLLTFRADGAAQDGSYHPIEVEVRGNPDAKVLYLPGYHVPEPFEDLHPLEKSLLAADALASAAPRREIGLDLLSASFQSESGQAYVPVIVEVDGDSLLAGHRGDALPLEIYAYASDSRGRMRDFFTQLLTLSTANARETLPGSGVKYYGHLTLGPGDHLLRVMVRNGFTGDTGVTSMRLVVPDFASGDPTLAGPFAPEPLGRWLLVRESAGGDGDSVVYPFTMNGEIYVPAARPFLSHEQSTELYLMAYGLEGSDLAVSGEIFAPDGETVGPAEVGLDQRAETGIEGYDKLLLTFHPPDLEPGDYSLHVRLQGEGLPAAAEALLRFRVED